MLLPKEVTVKFASDKSHQIQISIEKGGISDARLFILTSGIQLADLRNHRSYTLSNRF